MIVGSASTRRSAISAVRQPFRNELEDLELSLRQLTQDLAGPIRGRGEPRKTVEQPTRDGRGDQRVAGGDDADGGDEVGRRDVLEQEPARTGAKRVHDVLIRVERREHEDARAARLGIRACELSRRLHPVHDRHPDVHDDHVGSRPRSRGDRLAAVGGLPDDLDVLLAGQHHAEAGAHQLLVVDEQHTDAHVCGAASIGRLATTRKPSFVGSRDERPAQHRDSLAHPDQAPALVVGLHGMLRPGSALVVDRDHEQARLEAHDHLCAPALRVLE